MRIVSLIASATEIVCALGLGEKLVGRSHECDYPESVQSLPVCTAPKFATSLGSRLIDERLKTILKESLSIYRVDTDLLESLSPTQIITQTQCEVCAVSLRDVQEAACALIESSPKVVALQPDCLADIFEDIKKVGAACAAPAEAQTLVDTLKAAIAEIQGKCSGLDKRPAVVIVEWIDPLMPAANWMPELVRLAGGENLFGEEGKHSSVMRWMDISMADPDVMIVAPCGFSIAQTLEEMPLLAAKRGWDELACVKNNQVYVVDGKFFFNRPGPRVLESLQIMAEILHPQLFQFAQEGKSWLRYENTELE